MHNIEVGVRLDHSCIKGLNILPSQDVFEPDLSEGEDIVCDMQVYVTPSEVPNSLLEIILYSICSLGLYTVYMFLLNQRYNRSFFLKFT